MRDLLVKLIDALSNLIPETPDEDTTETPVEAVSEVRSTKKKGSVSK